METYHLITNWYFEAPIERVWEELTDVRSWPTWWPSWRKAHFRGSEPRAQLGTTIDNEVKGTLPYSLCFTTEVTIFQSPHLLELKTSGDLVGSGKFVLEERDGGTAVTYYWDVGTANPAFNLMGKLPFAKAMVEKNHDYVMAEGLRGLKPRVER
jgi:uncharacterized protein YndB with AHSA1/START domain